MSGLRVMDTTPTERVPDTSLRLGPITLRHARRFIGEHHRHNLPPHAWIVGVGVYSGEELVGVGILARPVVRGIDMTTTAEITRVCTTGTRNACSKLYGALARVAAGLGYQRVITYTLASEPGSSLLASGFRIEAEVQPQTWDRLGRPRVDVDLFGEERTPNEAKRKWVREVAA